jgi:uncharacterized repeat protein (TIGR01451 family)
MGVIVPAGQDQLRVSPERIVAPVCSEVLVKAAICGADGYLVANQPVDWSLDRCGVGQFGSLATNDSRHLLSWWDMPRRIDNWTALGTTAQEAVVLYRGTPDPRDDVQILRGDTWVTVTSATEGTSVVNACAPSTPGMNRATAVIHWVDADWVFPAAACVTEAGRPHVLTTTVTRRTSGTPLCGWIVRYNVARGASLGYGGGNSLEVPTDANGRASVEVSPNDAGGGSATVAISMIGPANTPAAGLELSRTTSTITWQVGAPAAAPAGPAPPTPPTDVPPSLDQPPALPGVSPPPTFAQPPQGAAPIPPAGQTPADPYRTVPPTAPPATSPPQASPYSSTPPAAAAQEPGGKAELDVQMRRISPQQVAVGEYASFEVVITNRGTGIARNVMLVDRFDRGLRHPKAQPNVYGIEYAGRDLPPGESQTVTLTFQVVDGGQHCHEITVSAEATASVSRRDCVTARQAALEVSLTGPRRQIVGESAAFSAVVRNVGDVPATNIELVFRPDPAIVPTLSETDARALPNGDVLIRIEKLEAGERRPIRLEGRCNADSNRACTQVLVTADGGVTAAAEACVEILPALGSGTPSTGAAPGTNGAAALAVTTGLKLTISENKNPARLREKQTIYITVENSGQQTETKVNVRAILPPEMTIDAAQIQPQNEATVLGQEVRFATISELRPGDQRRYVIPVTPNRAGQVQVRAQMASSNLTTPTTVDSNVIQILP